MKAYLQFRDEVHRKGLNVTIRKGLRYLGDIEAQVDGLGDRPIRVLVMRYGDINPAVISMFHHNTELKGFSEFDEEMQDIYGSVEEDDIVSLILYHSDPEGRLI